MADTLTSSELDHLAELEAEVADLRDIGSVTELSMARKEINELHQRARDRAQLLQLRRDLQHAS